MGAELRLISLEMADITCGDAGSCSPFLLVSDVDGLRPASSSIARTGITSATASRPTRSSSENSSKSASARNGRSRTRSWRNSVPTAPSTALAPRAAT